MKRIAEALDVARFRLAERMGKPPEKRPPRYSKEQDSVSLPFLPEINYRRAGQHFGLSATVFLNRRLSQHGKVLTLRRNLRWSADGFEIACTKAETVRVVFGLRLLRPGNRRWAS